MTGDSIARRVNGERLVLAGWSRAILLQMAHPLIAAGVAEHSAFRGGPTVAAHRLMSTVRAMLGLTFGDEATRGKVIDQIRGIHTRVRGTLREHTGPFPAGTPYSAEDPALVLWVHATLIDSTIAAYRAIIGELTPADADAYCDEAAWVAVALGATASEVPRTTRDLTAYMQSMYDSGVIVVGRDAQAIGTAVLSGPLTTIAFPAGWLNRLITSAWLTPPLREAYGLSWSERRARSSARAIAMLRASRRVMPPFVARFPDARRSSG